MRDEHNLSYKNGQINKSSNKVTTKLFFTTTAYRELVLWKIVTIYMRTLSTYLMS